METGDKIRGQQIVKSPSLDKERIKHCHAAFGLHAKGLDVIITDENKKGILAAGSFYWEYIRNTEELITAVEETLLSEEINFEECASANWCISHPKFSLLPQSMLIEEDIGKTLGYTCRIEESEVLQYDLWPQKVAAIYSFPQKWKEWISLYFPDTSIIHSSTAVNSLSSLYRQSGIFALLRIQPDTAELFISADGRVVLCNQFSYQVKEDLLYYCLYAFEQNGILAPEVDLKLAGISHAEESLQKLLLDYIGTVEDLKIPSGFIPSPNIRHSGIVKLIHLLGML